MPPFKLWLEFEATTNWGDLTNDFANIHVDMLDGRHYGINVWTFEFLKTAIQKEITDQEYGKGLYMVPPDLFVKELTRPCVEQAITSLLKEGNLEDVLNDSIFGLSYRDPWWDVLEMDNMELFLIAELKKEVGPNHPLFQQEVEVLAKRQDNDDVLFELEDGMLALVHLTHSGKQEDDPFPITSFYHDKREFWEQVMKEESI